MEMKEENIWRHNLSDKEKHVTQIKDWAMMSVIHSIPEIILTRIYKSLAEIVDADKKLNDQGFLVSNYTVAQNEWIKQMIYFENLNKKHDIDDREHEGECSKFLQNYLIEGIFPKHYRIVYAVRHPGIIPKKTIPEFDEVLAQIRKAESMFPFSPKLFLPAN